MDTQKITFTILDNGYFESDKAFVRGGNWGVNANRTPLADWIKSPVISVLIHHPEFGYILYDGGACRGDEFGGGRRPKEHERYMPFYAQEDQWIENQLAKCGITIHDLSMVIISHAHWEHMGILQKLHELEKPIPVLVPKADYAFGLCETRREGSDVFLNYLYDNFSFEGIDYTYIDQEREILPGIRLLCFNGHAPCVLGLMITTPNGVFVFPSDEISCEGDLSEFPGHSCMIHETWALRESIMRIRKLRQEGVTVIFPHDGEQFETLKKAPYWY